MFRNCERGYILQDLLLSLTCLIITTSLVIPLLQYVASSNRDLELTMLADQLLDEYLLEPHHYGSVQVAKDDENFTIEIHTEQNKILGCINWVNSKSKNERKCKYVPAFKIE